MKSPAQNSYGYPQGSSNVSPPTILSPRAPTSADVGYPIGQLWVYEQNGLYCLLSSNAGSANWTQLGASTFSGIQTLTPNVGAAISPVGGNIFLNALPPLDTSNGGAGVLDINLTGGVYGNVNTTNATPTQIYSYALTTNPAAQFFNVNFAAYNETTGGCAGFIVWGLSSTDGTSCTVTASNVIYNTSTADMSAANASIVAAGNSLQFLVQGVTGNTCHWNCNGFVCGTN